MRIVIKERKVYRETVEEEKKLIEIDKTELGFLIDMLIDIDIGDIKENRRS